MERRHVLHLLYSFSTGGMENVVVQLIHRLPADKFRHTVVALTEVEPVFASRVAGKNVDVIAMHKPPGQPFPFYPAMYRLFRKLRPDVLHTCNLAAMEFAPMAALAGIPLLVHAEHGWDVADPDGSNRIYRLYRRLYQRYFQQIVTVSSQLYDYFSRVISVPDQRLHLLPNGVDTDRFRPPQPAESVPAAYPFRRSEHWVIGTVGRLASIKNQPLLAQAFVQLVQGQPAQVEKLRLAIIGEGELAEPVRRILDTAGLLDRLWLPGNRTDIPDLLRAFDCFVLPSLAEGTSCSLQEAMATALPIVVTDVGGNRDLLENGACGELVPSGDAQALAAALRRVFLDPAAIRPKAQMARRVILDKYALTKVAERYQSLFGA
jgi:sugar transferase (PEP-CTERM/EpsH1 system associated)